MMIRNCTANKHSSALVVDDNPAHIKLAKLFLKQAGCRDILTAKSSKEALKLFSPDIDLIIVNAANIHLCCQFRKLFSKKHIPILAHIPFDEVIREDCLSMNVDGFIFKPARFSEFKTTIQRFLLT